MSAPELPPGTPPLPTTGEVAQLNRVEPGTVAKWARAGKVEVVLTGGNTRRYPSAQFADLLAVTGWPL